jgi:hypothetical protein
MTRTTIAINAITATIFTIFLLLVFLADSFDSLLDFLDANMIHPNFGLLMLYLKFSSLHQFTFITW